MMRFQLSLALIMATGVQAQAPASAQLSQWVGAYRDGPGDYIAITMMGGGAQPVLLFSETRTEQLRLLFPAHGDTFTIGPALTQPTPIERTLVFGPTFLETVDNAANSSRPRRYERVPIRSEKFQLRSGDVTLAGTLLLPAGAPAAAVVLAHGSENSDRNSFGPLPWVFAAHGYAVAIYDKRGTGFSSGSWESVGVEPLARDLAAVIDYIANRRDVGARRIAVVGVSEGGWVAAHASRLTPRINAIVAISGGARTKGDAYIYKTRRAGQEAGLAGMRLDSATAAASQTIEESQRRVALDSATVTGFDRRVTYDPTADWRQYRGAFLYLGGAADVLESAPAAADWYTRLFRTSGNPDYTIKVLPAAHHSLLHAIQGTPSEFATLKGIRELVPGYWSILLHWLDARLLR